LAGKKGVSDEELKLLFAEKTKGVYLATGKKLKYEDLLKARVDVDFVVRLERKNDSHAVSNKTLDYSETTIRQLIQDGYKEVKEQMNGVMQRIKLELR
jgi:NTE family protein